MIRTLTILFGFAMGLVGMQAQQLSMSLSDLYATAEQHNASLRSCRSAMEEAEAGIASAKAARLPDIDLSASVSYLGPGLVWDRNFTNMHHAHIPHFGQDFTLKAQQVVYAGGAIDASIKLSEQGSRMTVLETQQTRQQVRMLLTGLYLQLHSLENQQTVIRENINLTDTLIQLMQRRRDQGVALRNDVTRYELQSERFQLRLTQVGDRRDIVNSQLITALGLDSTLRLVPTQNMTLPETETEAYWQNLAATEHTALQQADLAVEMNRQKERIEKAERRPKIALVAGDELLGPITNEVPVLNNNFNYWYVGVGLTYNISSLYKSNRRLKQARLATQHAHDQRTVASEGIADAVHAAYVELQTAQSELRTHVKSVELADQNYAVISNRYLSGLALVTDMVDAANVKLEAELALANARINVLFQYYNLRFAAGTL